MASKSSKQVLSDLHRSLSEVLTKALRDGEVVVDKEGVSHKNTAPAAILNVARQFLKDNNIEGLPVEGSELGELTNVVKSGGIKLPFESTQDSPLNAYH